MVIIGLLPFDLVLAFFEAALAHADRLVIFGDAFA
jgi:hypothetical protein